MAEAAAEILKTQIRKCRVMLHKGYTSSRNSGLKWLNELCADFLEFSNLLHQFIKQNIKATIEGNNAIENIFLCLSQVVTCIKEMEITIKVENKTRKTISASRQHFLDRINWCLDRLYNSINLFGKDPNHDGSPPLEECSYIFLMDSIIENLEPYCTYSSNISINNVAEEEAEAMFTSKRVRTMVDLILGHALTFANVAMPKDKRPLSALCQNVLHDCMSFQDECALGLKKNDSGNHTDRNVKAISLQSSLYRLENYINDALIRLVYTSFLDYDRCSIKELRTLIDLSDDSQQNCNESITDALIADFDVNLDRTMQIGMFAIGFAAETSVKTNLRSCLASLESMDAYIIPSLQATKNTTLNLHSQILEQHYKYEIAIFKRNVQEIIESYAFTSCYYDMLSECIKNAEKHYQKQQFEDIIKKGKFLYEHFQVKANEKKLRAHQNRMELHEKFTIMLGECDAALIYADQIDTKRILKRFKILRSVLGKFVTSLETRSIDGKPKVSIKSKERIDFDTFTDQDLNNPVLMFEAQGIFTMVSSILYNPTSRRTASDSLKGNFSKLISPSSSMLPKEHKTDGAAAILVDNAADDNITQHLTESDRCGITSQQKTHSNDHICPTPADVTSKEEERTLPIAKQGQHLINPSRSTDFTLKQKKCSKERTPSIVKHDQHLIETSRFSDSTLKKKRYSKKSTASIAKQDQHLKEPNGSSDSTLKQQEYTIDSTLPIAKPDQHPIKPSRSINSTLKQQKCSKEHTSSIAKQDHHLIEPSRSSDSTLKQQKCTKEDQHLMEASRFSDSTLKQQKYSNDRTLPISKQVQHLTESSCTIESTLKEQKYSNDRTLPIAKQEQHLTESSCTIESTLKEQKYSNDRTLPIAKQEQHLTESSCTIESTLKEQKYSEERPPTIVKQDQHLIEPSRSVDSDAAASTQEEQILQTSLYGRKRSVRRKDSLRTSMFKCRKSAEIDQLYSSYKIDSASLQISAILDNLTSLSSQISHSLKESSVKMFDSYADTSDDINDVFNTTIIT